MEEPFFYGVFSDTQSPIDACVAAYSNTQEQGMCWSAAYNATSAVRSGLMVGFGVGVLGTWVFMATRKG